MVKIKRKKLSKKQSKRLWLFTIWIVVVFFFTFMMLNIYGPRISRESLLSVPIIKSALDENPDIQINETFISKDDSQAAILTILEKCGEDVEEMDFVLVELEHNGTLIKAYFDPATQEAICVYTELTGDAGSGGAGGGGGGGSGGSGDGGAGGGGGTVTDECSLDTDCDDSDPYTADVCVSGVCEYNLMTCAQIGGLFCGGSLICDSTVVTASDGSCCTGDCISDPGGGPEPLPDLCQINSDCVNTNPALDFQCIYNARDDRKECLGIELEICIAGDDKCPRGCDLTTDPDCL